MRLNFILSKDAFCSAFNYRISVNPKRLIANLFLYSWLSKSSRIKLSRIRCFCNFAAIYLLQRIFVRVFGRRGIRAVKRFFFKQFIAFVKFAPENRFHWAIRQFAVSVRSDDLYCSFLFFAEKIEDKVIFNDLCLDQYGRACIVFKSKIRMRRINSRIHALRAVIRHGVRMGAAFKDRQSGINCGPEGGRRYLA